MAKIKLTGEAAVLDRVERIRKAVLEKSVENLTDLAPYGYVSDKYRSKAWPILLGLDIDNIPKLDDEAEIDRELAEHEFIRDNQSTSTNQSTESLSNNQSSESIGQLSSNLSDTRITTDDQKSSPSLDQTENESKQTPPPESNQSTDQSESDQSTDHPDLSANDSQSVKRIPHPYQNEYTEQIEKDVDRSLNHFTELLKWPQQKRYRTRLSLNRLIQRVFAFNPDLHYIQGFHDIAAVFLLALDDFSLSFACLNELASTRMTKSLQTSIQGVLTDLDLLFPLLKQADVELYQTLIERVPQAWFTLSWVLTWFAHNVSNQSIATHWFDFFLASPPLMPVYAVAAISRANRSELMQSINQAVAESNEGEAQARVHQFFQHFDITTHEQVNELALEARSMYEMFPPSTLKTITPAPQPNLRSISAQRSRDLVEHLLGSNITGAIKAVSSTNQVIGSVLLVGAVGVAIAWAGPFSRQGGGGGHVR